jgi:putative copper export protein
MTLTSIIKFLHILATATWFGGMIYTNIVLMPSLSAIEPSQRGRLLGATTKRFSLLAWGSMIILVITGLIRTPAPMLLNVSSVWGTWLTLKHLLVIAMVVIGLLITFWLSPKMQSLSPSSGEQPTSGFLKVQKQLSVLARVNSILGGLVLLFSAIM